DELYQCYYDQAHFTKEFKRMTGYSPGKFTHEVSNEFGRRLCSNSNLGLSILTVLICLMSVAWSIVRTGRFIVVIAEQTFLADQLSLAQAVYVFFRGGFPSLTNQRPNELIP